MSEIPSSSRRQFFSKLLVTDNGAPNRATWHRVPEVGANDGDVLWSGTVINNTLFVVGDEGMILRYNGETDAQGRFWQPMDTLRDKVYLEGLWDSGTPPWKVWA